jgi:hypothetical protein
MIRFVAEHLVIGICTRLDRPPPFFPQMIRDFVGCNRKQPRLQTARIVEI